MTAPRKKTRAALNQTETELRDDFAARLAAVSFPLSFDHDETVAEWAARAYRLADALLAARTVAPAEPETPDEEAP